MDESQTLQRENWPAGAWDNEPDREEFHHAGMPCLAVRGRLGQWCGYAAVTPDHPLHGRCYDDELVDLDVHGGLTYSGPCQGHICHTAKPAEADDVWWFGFDCAHLWDLVPGMLAVEKKLNISSSQLPGEVYRDLDYARNEVRKLAEQLSNIQG